MATDWTCEPLSGSHRRDEFDCGVPALNRYLTQRAGQDVRRKSATVYVMRPRRKPASVCAYFSLSAASIEFARLPIGISKRLARYPMTPAILIGRLAVDVNSQGVGLGALTLYAALNRCLLVSEEIGASLVVVDAKDDQAQCFYQRFGFNVVENEPLRLVLPIKSIPAK
jgi:predicted GNAT family N-acyltransferase